MPKTNTKTKSKTQEKKSQSKQNQQLSKDQRKNQRHKYQRGVAKDLNSYAAHFKEFESELKPLGLIIKDVDGDGNCLFRSISYFMEGTEKSHMKYRQIAVDRLEQHKEFYSLFIEDDITFEAYLTEMSQDGEWGGHHELQALTSVLSVNFLIHMKSRPAMIITSMSEGLNRIDALKTKKTIHLAYHLVDNVAEHYSSIRLISDDTQDPAQDIPLNNLGMNLSKSEGLKQADDDKTNFSDVEKCDSETEKESTFQIQQQQARNKKCKCGSKKAFKLCCALNRPSKHSDKETQKSSIIFV